MTRRSTEAETLGRLFLEQGWPKNDAEAKARKAVVVAAQANVDIEHRLSLLRSLAHEIETIYAWRNLLGTERLAQVAERVKKMSELIK